MSKYLTKLKAGTSEKGPNNMGSKFNFLNMNCGNYYKEGLKHRFESKDKKDIPLLIDIIKRFRFGTIITNVTENSFEFENTKETIQIFFFRICRYTRNSDICKILTDTIMINKSGVTIQNAFLLAHYYNYCYNKNSNSYYMKGYYNGGMDGFYDPSLNHQINLCIYLNKPFSTLKEFHSCFNVSPAIKMRYNYIFMYEGNTTTKNYSKKRIKLFELLKEEKFKSAERYLKSIFKNKKK